MMKTKQLFIAPKIKVMLSFDVSIKGKQLSHWKTPAHSFVRNWFNLLFVMSTDMVTAGTTYGAGYLNNKNVSGSGVAIGWSYPHSILAGAGADNMGILLGRGSTAESFEDYALTTKIAHGTGTNQLTHSASTATTAVYTAGTKTWAATLKRIFNNNSSAQIDVTETAIYDNNGYGTFMLMRDLLAVSVHVPVGAQLTVTYLMSMTLPG